MNSEGSVFAEILPNNLASYVVFVEEIPFYLILYVYYDVQAMM